MKEFYYETSTTGVLSNPLREARASAWLLISTHAGYIPIVSLCLLPVTSFAAKTSGCQIVTSGLIACYPFTDNANDTSGNKHNGTVNGATLTSDIIGNPNSAYSFNGAGNYIQVQSNLNFGSAFTLSTWISAPKEYRKRDILVKGNRLADPGYVGIYLSEMGEFKFYASDLTHVVKVAPTHLDWCPHNFQEAIYYHTKTYGAAPDISNPIVVTNLWATVNMCLAREAQTTHDATVTADIGSGVVVDDGQFHHLVVTYGNNQLIFYVDGKNVHQETVSGNVANVVASTLIGKQPNSSLGDTMFFKGTMDDVILYNRVLSASEVVQLEDIMPKCGGITNGLVGCYSFENNLLDGSGNGNHGNPVNISYIPRKDGYALSLNGMKSFAWIPNPAQQFDSEYTISGWILKRDDTGSGPVFQKYSWNGWQYGGWGFGLAFNTPAADSPDGYGGHTLFSAFVAGGTPSLLAYPQYTFPLNEFKYVTATYDKTGTFKLYIDGVQVDQKSYPHASLAGNYYNILLGDGFASDGKELSSDYNGGRTFNGAIDELRLYNRALSDTEVRQLAGIATLTVNQTGTGSVTCNGTPCQASYPLNSTITLTAKFDANSAVQWSGACSGTTATTKVTLTQDPTTCTATFTKVKNTLTVSMNGTGKGSLTCNGTPCKGAVSYPANTVVTVAATPDANSQLATWGGDCGTGTTTPAKVTLNGDKTCVATFMLKTYTLTIKGTGKGTGTVSAPSLTCKFPSTTPCSHTYSAGSKQTLKATPSKGSVFKTWTCDGSSAVTTATTQVIMDAATKTCTVDFE